MKRVSLSIVLSVASVMALAAEPGAYEKCGATKDDKARLACYDQVRDVGAKAAQSGSSASGYQEIALVDLKVDAKQLMGHRVATVALIQVMGDTAMLKSDEMDMAPIWATFEGLPRDDRKKLASGCQMLLCKGQFAGTLKRGPFGSTLALEKVSWR